MSASLVLRTALNIEDYKNVMKSPVASTEIRLNQYIDGLYQFKDLVPLDSFTEVLVVDNTINSTYDFDKRIKRALPIGTNFVATGTNRFGKYNKGAGDVETYRHLFRSGMLKTDFIVHFEPRLKLSDPTIFIDFAVNNRSLLCVSPQGESIQTGYMFLASKIFEEFCSIKRLVGMTLRQKSIEDVMFEFALKKKVELINNYTCSFRSDPITGREIPY